LHNSASKVRITADSTPLALGVVSPYVHLCLLLHFGRALEVYTDRMLHCMGYYTYLR